MDERMDAPNGKRIVELLRKAATGGYEGGKGRVMDNLAQLIDCDGDMHFHTIGKLADMVEEAIQHEHESAYDAGYDAGFASADDWLAQHEDAMAVHGWVKLPKDADGEYIHIGDVVVGKEDGEEDFIFEVYEIAFFPDGSCSVRAANDFGFDPWQLHHHKQPTVEDVLDEFASAYDRIGGEDEEHQKYLNLIAEYAKRLTLRGDGE